MNLQINQKHFFCFCISDIVGSNEWAINHVQGNFSPRWYWPGNIQKHVIHKIGVLNVGHNDI